MIVILVVIMVISLFANWKYIFPEKKKPNVVTAEDVQKSSGTATAAKVEMSSSKKKDKGKKERPKDETPVDYAKMLALSEEDDWSGDPFALLKLMAVKNVDAAALQPVSEPGEGKEESVELRLESILVTPFGGIAVINRQSLEKGDEISGGKIMRITPQTVYWEKDGKTRELTLPEDKIPLSWVRE